MVFTGSIQKPDQIMWFLTNDKKLAIAMIPKAGVNTFRSWLQDYDIVENDDPALLECDTRVAFIRNPMSRLVSAYSYFKGLNEDGVKHSVNAPTDSWESFVDYILLHDDIHWRPQILHTGGKQTRIHLFEELNYICSRYISRPIPWKNKSSTQSTSYYRIIDITSLYKEDLEMRKQVFV